MVSARVVLNFCSLTAVAASECTHGECKSETATMLQTQKRRGGATKLSNTHKSVTELKQSTMRLLREGGTEEVVKFAEQSMEEISEVVLAAIEHTHKVEQGMIDETVAKFETIANRYQDKVDKLTKLRTRHSGKSQEHLTCRRLEATACDAHTTCANEEATLKTKKEDARGEFEDAVDAMKHCDGDTNEPMSQQQSKHGLYKETGKAFFEAWEEYETQSSKCNGLKADLETQKAKCDALKQELEFAACSSHEHYSSSYDDMVQNWEFQESQYNDIKKNVMDAEADRKTEFETLAEVKCLLAKVKERGGKPCDSEEPEGEAEEIEKHCSEDSKDSTHLEMKYPEPAPQPTKPDEEPYPCTPAFLMKEYGSLQGHCFADMPECKACESDDMPEFFHDVCIKAAGNHPSTISLAEDTCVSSIHFQHTGEGKVSCRKAATGDSNFGCDTGSIGLVLTDGGAVTAPVFGTVNGMTPHYAHHAHWYTMKDVGAESPAMEWVFKEPVKMLKKDYQLWYNEDLSGGTEGDNRGEACYDLMIHKGSSCNALAPLQFRDVCTSAHGDQPGTITLPADTCVTDIEVNFIKGSVSCAGGGGHSNFGCGTDLVGLVWTEGGKTEVMMPKDGEVEGVHRTTHNHAHWYKVDNVGKSTRTLAMKLKDGVAPKKVSGDLNLWYSEDLTGGTESDNEGTACYEVAVHRALSC